MDKVFYPELSYKIIGIVFAVCNKLGYGFQEKVYEKAIALELKKERVTFKEQLCCDLVYENEKIAKYFLDFLVEDKIVLELKVGKSFRKKDFDQILTYLKTNNLKLGILVIFSPDGVRYRRILN